MKVLLLYNGKHEYISCVPYQSVYHLQADIGQKINIPIDKFYITYKGKQIILQGDKASMPIYELIDDCNIPIHINNKADGGGFLGSFFSTWWIFICTGILFYLLVSGKLAFISELFYVFFKDIIYRIFDFNDKNPSVLKQIGKVIIEFILFIMKITIIFAVLYSMVLLLFFAIFYKRRNNFCNSIYISKKLALVMAIIYFTYYFLMNYTHDILNLPILRNIFSRIRNWDDSTRGSIMKYLIPIPYWFSPIARSFAEENVSKIRQNYKEFKNKQLTILRSSANMEQYIKSERYEVKIQDTFGAESIIAKKLIESGKRISKWLESKKSYSLTCLLDYVNYYMIAQGERKEATFKLQLYEKMSGGNIENLANTVISSSFAGKAVLTSIIIVLILSYFGVHMFGRGYGEPGSTTLIIILLAAFMGFMFN